MSKASSLFIFITGAALGSAVTWKILKDKYEQIAQDEIDSVKEVFANKENKKTEEEKVVAEESEHSDKPDLMDYAAKLRENGYTNYSNSEVDAANLKKDGDNSVLEPYVISPDEFGENEEFEQISLTYYSDHILTDDNDEIIEDVEDVVGVESLNHFGEFEDDSVFVRNERLKCDYEILLDQQNYYDSHPEHSPS